MKILYNLGNVLAKKIKHKKNMFQILQAGGRVPSLHCKKENLKYQPIDEKDFIAHLIKGSGNYDSGNTLRLHFGNMI